MDVRHVHRDEIIEMIRRAAAADGLSLREFHDAGQANELENADLRDLWLIWGSSLQATDLEDGDRTPVG